MKDRKLDDCCCYVDLDFTKEKATIEKKPQNNVFKR